MNFITFLKTDLNLLHNFVFLDTHMRFKKQASKIIAFEAKFARNS